MPRARARSPQADREPADLAAGRSARVRARRDRHPAQRRRQGQPVLPARLQPRPRHRLRDLRRRHAGQHADARARPGLHRPELPDPRAGRSRVDYRKGPYYAEDGDFASAGVGAHRPTSTRLPRGVGVADARPGRLRPRAARRLGRTRRAATLLYALEAAHNDGPWQNPENSTASSTACCATRSGDDAQRLQRSPPWPTRPAGTRPTRFRSAPSTPA